MRLASIVTGAGLDVALQFPRTPPFLLSEMRRAGVGRRAWGPTLLHLVSKEEVDDLRLYAEAFQPNATPLRPEDLRFATPFPHPGKIWGIGLNFREHAADLGAESPEEPGSWMRPSTTLADPAGPIRLPQGIGRVTGEGEIGVLLGKPLRNATSPEEALSAIAGFVLVLDMTAEDLLRKNTRYLTRAKSYDTFCVPGPWVVTPDEWRPRPDTIVRTMLNGKAHRENRVGNMAMQPLDLVAFHSRIFPWEAGDLLLTGTPGAAPLEPGCRIGASVDGLGEWHVPVVA